MTSIRFYAITAVVVIVGLVVASRASADDAPRDWSQSMGFSSPSQVANSFNAALALRNLQRGGSGGAGGGNTYNCQSAAACPQGNVTQWSGVAVTTITGSGITVDNTIDADSNQDADVATCADAGGCDIDF